jgi:hypothetical protein
MGTFALERPSCPICDILFETRKMLKAHKRNAHTRCSFCKKRFFGQKELESHQREVGHSYCKECNLCFSASSIQLQHVRTVEHTDVYQCCDCERQYHGQIYLDNHCCDCDRVFKGSQGLHSHLTSHKLHHPRTSEPRVDHQQASSQNLICGTKKNTTINSSNKSNRRRPIYCPVSAQCKKRFAKPSALISHLESGSCVSGWTRDKLNTMITVHDQDRLISAVYVDEPLVTPSSTQFPQPTPQDTLLDTNLFTSGNPVGDGTDADEWLLVERSASRSIMKADNDSRSEWSMVSSKQLFLDNSEWSLSACTASVDLEPHLLFSGLQCTLCPLSRPCFPTLEAWRTHTMSAAHAPKIFRCPTALLPEVKSGIARKEKFFSTLSGLSQHLESGACHGKGTLRLVFKYLEEQLNLLRPCGVDLLT